MTERLTFKPLTMSDIRLCAGEGKLTNATILQAANALFSRRWEARHLTTVSEGERLDSIDGIAAEGYALACNTDKSEADICRLGELFDSIRSIAAAPPVLSTPVGREALIAAIEAEDAYRAEVRDEQSTWLAGLLADRILALFPTTLKEVELCPREVAYGALWRMMTDDPALLDARRALLTMLGGLKSGGQRRAIAWARKSFPEPTAAEMVRLDFPADATRATSEASPGNDMTNNLPTDPSQGGEP